MRECRLEDVSVVVAEESPAYVTRAVEDLVGALQVCARGSVVLGAMKRTESRHLTTIEIATDTVELAPGELRVRVVSERHVEAKGGDALSTSYAVMALRRTIVDDAPAGRLPWPLEIHEKPHYRKRGVYLHQHWRYNSPYATWAWSLSEWRAAIDILAEWRINLVMIWAHSDMIASPLSDEEQRHFETLRAVIDYARNQRGLEVWLVEPANVVLDAPDVSAQSMSDRDYYAHAHMAGGGLKCPSDADGVASLLANRELLFEQVPNADGYGYIDSDPGGWIGSPADEFVNLLSANRDIANRLHERPDDVTLFCWVFAGWGVKTTPENWRDTMAGVVEEVTPPIAFLASHPPQLSIARDLGVLSETLAFPYGAVEGEPAFPSTEIKFEQIDAAFEGEADPWELSGVMANVQTFVVQFPNLYYFASLAWQGPNLREGSPDDHIESLAMSVLPEAWETLAGAWHALSVDDSAVVRASLSRLQGARGSGTTQRLGTLGERILPSLDDFLEDLIAQLNIHLLAVEVPGAADHEIAGRVRAFLEGLLEWQRRTGFFGAYGVDGVVVYDQFSHTSDCQKVHEAWCSALTSPAAREIAEQRIIRELEASGYDSGIVSSMAGQLFGTAAVRVGEIEKERLS